MKTSVQFLIAFLMAAAASAEFRTWTRADGKTAELDLISVTDAEGVKTAEFKMRSGKSIAFPAASFVEADAKLIAEWQPADAAAAAEAAVPPGPASVFDEALEGNLVKLSGKSLKPTKEATKPTKYYLFYYTASWCPPCHKFTPSLVDFYKTNKDENFEIILITSDEDEGAMEEYAAEMKMPWPQLKLSKTEKFKQKFNHPGRGIPNLVLTDLEGKLIKGSYENDDYIGPTAVMKHLATLLKK